MKPHFLRAIIQWLPLAIAALGCSYFIYDNIVFLINYKTWIPDRELNLWVSVSMLTASVITLFNLMWLMLAKITRRPPINLMKPILAISGALSLIFAISLILLIIRYLISEQAELSTILITVFTVSVILVVVNLWQVAFSRKQIT